MIWMTWFGTHGPLLMVVSHVSQHQCHAVWLSAWFTHPAAAFPWLVHPFGKAIVYHQMDCLCKTRFLVLVMPSMAATNLSAAWHKILRLAMPYSRSMPGPWKSMSAWIFCILKPRKATLVETDSKPVTPKGCLSPQFIGTCRQCNVDTKKKVEHG